MPCGQRCKELIDGWNAAIMAGNCMAVSILLTSQTSDGPPPEMAREFLAQARQLAETAQKIAHHLTPSVRTDEGGT